jgi:hypothetical protein
MYPNTAPEACCPAGDELEEGLAVKQLSRVSLVKRLHAFQVT